MEQKKENWLFAGQKSSFKILLGVLAAVVLVGLGLWVWQLVSPVELGGTSDTSPWGSYIIAFMTFVGLSAGGLIVASSAHVFGIERFKPVALPAVIMSTVCICAAAGLVIVDLRNTGNIWRLFTGPNPISPLMWDVCVISIYLVINILDIIWISKGDERKVEVLSRVALPTAILVHSVTAWIFSLQVARVWHTAIMAPIFVVSACDSGLALLLLGLVWLKKLGIFEAGANLMKSLAGLLATFLAVDAFLLICEVLNMGYPGAGEAEALAIMTTGATAPYFWFEVIFGLIVPFMILVFSKNRERQGLVVLASILIVLGVVCKRIWLLLTAFIAPFAEGLPVLPAYAFVDDAYSVGGLTTFYAPTVVELVITAAVIALAVLAFVVLAKWLCGKKKADCTAASSESKVSSAKTGISAV